MGRLVFLGSEDMVLGFALAGLETAPGSPETLERLLGQDDVTLVGVPQSLFEGLSERVRERAEASNRPVVVPFPWGSQLGHPGSADEVVLAMVRRAIGYHLVLRR